MLGSFGGFARLPGPATVSERNPTNLVLGSFGEGVLVVARRHSLPVGSFGAAGLALLGKISGDGGLTQIASGFVWRRGLRLVWDDQR